jgi:hypothetical protein
MEKIKSIILSTPVLGIVARIIYQAAKRLPVIVPFKATYAEDALITNKNISSLFEPDFLNAYQKAVDDGLYVDAAIRWRCHVACWAGSVAIKNKGDFVECGVNKGFISRIVMDYLKFEAREDIKFWLLDTYEGFSEKYLTEEEISVLKQSFQKDNLDASWKMGQYKPVFDIALKAFSKFPNARLIKGIVPETLSLVESDKISYLSLDMNCVIPEIEAISYFWDKLVPGAIVLLDDYAWPSHEAQKNGMDKFASSKGVGILTLPTGQGLIIKN